MKHLHAVAWTNVGVTPYAVVPSEDAHSSEYIAPCDARRQFVSGFSGSAGCAVISADKAVLATDGRYFNQAAQQLDSNWTLLKQGIQDVPTWQEWTATESAGGKVVGVDPTLLSSSMAKKLDEKVKKAGGSGVVAVPTNLIDAIWATERPPQPSEAVVLLDEKFAGKDTKSKLADLRKELEKKSAAGFVVSLLDEVAWLFNLRGNDIPYNPVFFSYALVTPDKATLYVDQSKLSKACCTYLAENSVTVKPYGAIFADAKVLSEAAASDKSAAVTKKFLLSTRTSWALVLALGGEGSVEEVRSPIGDAKAIKNDNELEGMRQCHIRDGVALIQYFAWLESQLKSGVDLDEVTAADKLEALRSVQERYVGLSFPTISSTGAK